MNSNTDKYKYSVAEVALELHAAAVGHTNQDIKPLDLVSHYEWLSYRVKVWAPSIHKTYRSQLFDVAILQLCLASLAEAELLYRLAVKKRNGNGNHKK